jgi:hypothetical protein
MGNLFFGMGEFRRELSIVVLYAGHIHPACSDRRSAADHSAFVVRRLISAKKLEDVFS